MTRPARRRALVTGGGRGIGAAIVRALCADGADVTFTVTRETPETEALERDCVERFAVACAAVVADQGDPSTAEVVVSRASGERGTLDIAVVNAGVSRWSPIDEPLSAADREELFRVNLFGALATMRAAASVLADHGRIVVIGSTAAERAGGRGLAEYAASKGALAAFVRAAARDLGPRGITVNLVRPGHVATGMNPSTTSSRRVVAREAALGRFGEPHEIAAVVAFLAGPAASYVTGATIDVDGGALA